jgi:hypothetical protein
MADPPTDGVVSALLDRHGRTFGEELGVDVASGTPSPLFRLLCASLLMSARISAGIATAAARALADSGWTTAERLAESSWEDRARVLNQAGYARYDERTSTMLGETATLVLDRYGGDLRRLREDAGCDPAEERRRVKECKGIGDVGADIFFREVQAAWPEVPLRRPAGPLGRRAHGDGRRRRGAGTPRVRTGRVRPAGGRAGARRARRRPRRRARPGPGRRVVLTGSDCAGAERGIPFP